MRLVLLVVIVLLNGFSYFFNMKFFFPEVIAIQREPGEAESFPPDTQVLGLTVGDVPVAYPILEMVMPRHIVHDTISGQPILVSYCALCRSALAFAAEHDNRTLYFEVAGVWRRNMIMVDVQTHSVWQQATGKCIFGEYKGSQLEVLLADNTIWKRWLDKHQNTEAAIEFTEARKGLSSREKMLAGLKMVTTKVMLPGFTNLDGLPKREIVFGVVVNGHAKAYPKSDLTDAVSFADRVGEVELTLVYDDQAEQLQAMRSETDESILVEKHWWLGWKEFHPNTEIWQKQ